METLKNLLKKKQILNKKMEEYQTLDQDKLFITIDLYCALTLQEDIYENLSKLITCTKGNALLQKNVYFQTLNTLEEEVLNASKVKKVLKNTINCLNYELAIMSLLETKNIKETEEFLSENCTESNIDKILKNSLDILKAEGKTFQNENQKETAINL